MAVSERDVDATARLVIRQHGGSASYFAAGRADELLDAGDSEGAVVWRRVLVAIKRLQLQEPHSTIQ
jgi:hypothetical protein